MRLFLRDGYAATTILSIAAESGVSRSSVFRYWGSKSDIVWSEFDRHVERLSAMLASSVAPTMAAVREAVVANLRLSMEDSPLWLERFAVIETTPELRIEEAARWERWAHAVAEHVAARHGLDSTSVVPQSIGGAVQAAFLASLRAWRSQHDQSAAVLTQLDSALAPLCCSMQAWLPGT